MAGGVNKVIIVGNLGGDPEVRTFQNGGKVANMRIATSESWKDRQTGEKRERTEWHSISIQNDGLVGVVEKYCRKGDKLYIEGQLQTRKWQDQSGNDRYSTEVVVRGYAGKVEMLSSRRDGGGGSGGSSGGSGGAGQSDNGGGSGGDGWGGGADDLDDDVPF